MFYRQILGAILLVFSFGACGKQKEINEENTSKFKPSSVFVSQSQEDKDSHKKMLDALSIIKLSTNDKNKYLGDLRARQVRGLLYQTKSELSKEKKWFYNRILGWSELNLGNEEEGIKHLKNAYDLLPEVKKEIEEKREAIDCTTKLTTTLEQQNQGLHIVRKLLKMSYIFEFLKISLCLGLHG